MARRLGLLLCLSLAACDSETLVPLDGAIEVAPEQIGLVADVGTVVTSKLAINNIGEGELELRAVAMEDPSSEVSVETGWLILPIQISPNDGIELDVRFAPRAEGMGTSKIIITSGDARRPVLEVRVLTRGRPAPPPCVDCCTVDQVRSCYPGPESELQGACRAGEEICGADRQWGACAGFVMPVEEICDNAIDEDCDGTADDGCPEPPPPPPPPPPPTDEIPVPEVNVVACEGEPPSSGNQCVPFLETPVVPVIQSSCRLPFPSAKRPPCEVAMPGTQYYLDPVNGDDTRSGLSPAEAWATLCHALATIPPGNTLRLAEGNYPYSSVSIETPITVVGGFDSTFTVWDPDTFHSVFLGRLTLGHGGAVWAGFYMQAAAASVASTQHHAMYHQVKAGKMLRNYVELIWTGDEDDYYFYGIVPSPCRGTGTVVACNDIYFHSSGPASPGASGVEYGNIYLPAGRAWLLANRICMDSQPAWFREVVSGYGTCDPSASAEIFIANNIIEAGRSPERATGISFYGCSNRDLFLTVTNNTIIGADEGISGYESDSGADVVRWKITNNIIAGSVLGQTAVAAGIGRVEITTSENNLTFGFANNAISPPPLMSSGDDTTGAASMNSVFVNAANDFAPNPNGEAAGTGLNIYGDPSYGALTTDLLGRPRPMNGAWERGALQVGP